MGLFLFWNPKYDKNKEIENTNKLHEYGHSIQSRIFGPLYLLFIGVPSFLRVIYSRYYYYKTKKNWSNYYNGYPENWANKLSKRK